MRAETARKEFETHGLSHLVEVHHKDVCGKQPVTTEDETIRGTANRVPGGFDLPGRSVNAIFLDLPEPWLAVPHAAYTLKPDGRLASYSPCIEQTQRTVAAMTAAGFHTIKTMEFRIRENYVDEVDYELPPKEKRPRIEPNPYLVGNNNKQGHHSAAENDSGGEDTGAEADNEKSEISETEADQLSLATAGTTEETAIMDAAIKNPADAAAAETKQKAAIKNGNAPKGTGGAPSEASNKTGTSAAKTDGGKRKKMLIARPFPTMRGHTAFLTFATAGNAPQPDPNKATSSFIS